MFIANPPIFETNRGIQPSMLSLEKALRSQNRQLKIIVKIKNKGTFFISWCSLYNFKVIIWNKGDMKNIKAKKFPIIWRIVTPVEFPSSDSLKLFWDKI